MPTKRQPSANSQDGEESEPLTARNFGKIFQRALKENFNTVFVSALEQPEVQEALGRSLGALIELTVAEKVDEKCKVLQERVQQSIRAKDKEIKELREEICSLKKDQDELNAYSRREDLIIKNLEVKESYSDRARGTPSSEHSENVKRAFVDFTKEKLGVDVPMTSISTAHSLPKKSTGPPTYIVRFTNRDHRNMVFEKKWRLKGQGIYIEEHVTKDCSELLYKARVLKRSKKILDCSTRNCRAVVKTLDGRWITINSVTDIDRLSN